MARPPVNTGLRLPPFTKADLAAVLKALEGRGETVKQDDLIAVLLKRATALVGNKPALDLLGQEMRFHRAKARKVGY
jgi:hypothetical protein